MWRSTSRALARAEVPLELPQRRAGVGEGQPPGHRVKGKPPELRDVVSGVQRHVAFQPPEKVDVERRPPLRAVHVGEDADHAFEPDVRPKFLAQLPQRGTLRRLSPLDESPRRVPRAPRRRNRPPDEQDAPTAQHEHRRGRSRIVPIDPSTLLAAPDAAGAARSADVTQPRTAADTKKTRHRPLLVLDMTAGDRAPGRERPAATPKYTRALGAGGAIAGE